MAWATAEIAFFLKKNKGGSLNLRPPFMFTFQDPIIGLCPMPFGAQIRVITSSHLTVCPLSSQVKMPCPVAPSISKPSVLPSD